MTGGAESVAEAGGWRLVTALDRRRCLADVVAAAGPDFAARAYPAASGGAGAAAILASAPFRKGFLALPGRPDRDAGNSADRAIAQVLTPLRLADAAVPYDRCAGPIDAAGFLPAACFRVALAASDGVAADLGVTRWRPKPGDALLYWPGRVSPVWTGAAGLVEVAFMPVPLRDGAAIIGWRDALRDTDDPVLPIFLPRHVPADPARPFAGVERLDDDIAFAALIDALTARLDPADRDFLAHLCHLIRRADANDFLTELQALADRFLPPDLADAVTGYVGSVRRDVERYATPAARDHGFWPNPTHPTRPAILLHTKPYARRLPLLDRTTPIATAGSCFASEISTVLQEGGYNYVVGERADDAGAGVAVDGYMPGDALVPFSASYGLLFNTPSLLRLAERAFGVRDFKKILLWEGSDLIDPYRENVYFRDPAAFAADYPRHTAALRHVLTAAEIFVFTLGLNECWCYRDDGSAISRNPRWPILPLVEHRRLTVAENIAHVAAFFRLCRQHNPRLKLILTVSPVPFLATGLSDTAHVIEANCHSKSVLRVAAQELVDSHPDIHYFPSFEMVTHTLPDPWEADLRHVKRAAVQEIVAVFQEMFGA